MLNLNRVMIGGNLTRQPQSRQAGSRNTVTVFGVAINERYTTRDGEERRDVSFVEVEAWGRRGDLCAQRLDKGSGVLVEGRLRSSSWQDAETGQHRSKVVIRADRVHFMDRPHGDGEVREDSDDDGADSGTSPGGDSLSPQQRSEAGAAGPVGVVAVT